MKPVRQLLPRLIAPTIRAALKRFPVVILTGARQTGKSTLAVSEPIGRNRLYRSLDDFDVLERAQTRPDVLIGEAPLMTIDEVQRAPEILMAIKRSVDKDRQPGRFLLTGSAHLLMMRRVSESLAGRAVYLNLWPMTESEKKGRPDAGLWDRLLKAESITEARKHLKAGVMIKDWPKRVQVGGYPISVLATDPAERSTWFEGYIRTYLERDLQDVSSIAALSDFRRMMRLSALRVGQVLNQTNLARDAGLSQPTAHRYLNLLETSFQIVRIPAFAVSRTKRLVKSPKLFWTDCGLGSYLAGFTTQEALMKSQQGGAFLENLVLTQLLAWRETTTPRPEIHFWRTQIGEEVDFVIESGQRVLPIEVKAATRLGLSDIKSLQVFLSEYSKIAPIGIVLYSGSEVIPMSRQILAVPLSIAFG